MRLALCVLALGALVCGPLALAAPNVKLPRQQTGCQTVFPIPRARPSNSTTPYPIQITISSNSSSTNSSSSGCSPTSISSSQSQRRQSSPASLPPLEIGFSLPQGTSTSGSGPCTLMLDLTSPDAKVSGGPATINVFALDGPAAGALVGTVRFKRGARGTVNSFACRDQEMCYRLELADGDGNGNDGNGGGGSTGGGSGSGSGSASGDGSGSGSGSASGSGSDDNGSADANGDGSGSGSEEDRDTNTGSDDEARPVQYLQGGVMGMGFAMTFGC
ncbi:hypothetical protein VTI74DRAFT_4097 [Chaetomium olivicolor]